nr:hypothetical protein JUJ52_17705 [Virgibacillus sp. AGTR]
MSYYGGKGGEKMIEKIKSLLDTGDYKIELYKDDTAVQDDVVLVVTVSHKVNKDGFDRHEFALRDEKDKETLLNYLSQLFI